MKKKELDWQRYPHIDLLTRNTKLRRMLLGKYLTWTIKEDGENVTIWRKRKQYNKRKYDVLISSRNQEQAASDIQMRVKISPQFPIILQMIEDNPTYRVIVESCKKGVSVTRIKKYSENTLIVIDIYDTAIENFLPYTLVYQTCFHYGLPCVKFFTTTRHKTMKDLLAFKNFVLKWCEANHEEGMVLKTFEKDGKLLMAKVKQDTPEPIMKPKLQSGAPILPQIPENEIMGAISHVESDFGLTGNPKDDMPRIAKAVAEECKKHCYSSRGNLFTFYQEYLENRK